MKKLIICDDTKITEVSDFCRANGFGIEVQSFYDPVYINRTKNCFDIHRKAIGKIEPRSFHGPFGDLCPGSFDALVRDVACIRFEFAVDSAALLGINKIILHHGYVPKTTPPTQWVKRLTEFWKDFLKNRPENLNIYLENVLEFDPAMMIELIDAVNDPRLSVCLDTGHVNCNSKTSMSQWIEKLGQRIGYVHLHDNNGEQDEHLHLGEGTIDTDEMFNCLNEHAPRSLWAIESRLKGIEKTIELITKYT